MNLFLAIVCGVTAFVFVIACAALWKLKLYAYATIVALASEASAAYASYYATGREISWLSLLGNAFIVAACAVFVLLSAHAVARHFRRHNGWRGLMRALLSIALVIGALLITSVLPIWTLALAIVSAVLGVLCFLRLGAVKHEHEMRARAAVYEALLDEATVLDTSNTEDARLARIKAAESMRQRAIEFR